MSDQSHDGDGAGEGQSLGGAAGVLGEAFGQAMRVALRRGRTEVGRAASTGRHVLQLRQYKADRDAMLRKVGMEVLRLVEAGEVTHPGLVRSARRVADLDVEIAEAKLRSGNPDDPVDPAPEEKA